MFCFYKAGPNLLFKSVFKKDIDKPVLNKDNHPLETLFCCLLFANFLICRLADMVQ